MNRLGRRLLCGILTVGLMAAGMETGKAAVAESDDGKGGYLAVFVAQYEYNMGVEHAQFPSGNYTDNRRTDVLYYALSRDGINYKGMNRDRAVYYPDDMRQLGSPSVFKKADGTYGMIASDNNKSSKIILSDSDDLLTFSGDRMKNLNSKGIVVTDPEVEYSEKDNNYNIYWSSPEGENYVTKTTDFESFSEPELTSHERKAVTGTLPVYAKTDEASVYKLDEDEYNRIEKKYGNIHSVSIKGAEDISVKPGEKVTVTDKLQVVYSDDSTVSVGVDWKLAESGLNTDNAAEGDYTIQGTVRGTTVYNTPVAGFRADPYILYNEDDGYYYMTGSYMQADLKEAYDYVVIRKAKTINELTDAEEVKIFSGAKKSEAGVNVTPDYWAPEIHKIGGLYRILVQGTVDGKSHQIVLTCTGGDLMEPADWSYTGYIGNTTDGYEIGPFDTTYFEYEGQGYYITQHTSGGSKLDITTVDPSDPLTPTGPRVSIAVPTKAYENNIGTGQSILEGPAAILHDGKIFVTYSGATIDMHYCTNLVYADINSDLMDPESWTKYQMPLFTTSDITTTVKDSVLEDANGEYVGQMGPGHSNFTVDENGNPLLVYHARDWSESYATGNDKYGLSDPGRHAYVKCIHFGADGMPVFNMTQEETLAENLRNVTLKVHVRNTDVKPAADNAGNVTNATAAPTAQPKTDDTGNKADSGSTEKIVKNKIYTAGGSKYKVIDTKKCYVEYSGVANKKAKKAVIPKSIKLAGKRYKVTAVSAKAFYKCTSLKRITIKSETIKSVGKKAFAGLNGRVTVKLPKKVKKSYKKMVAKQAAGSRLRFK